MSSRRSALRFVWLVVIATGVVLLLAACGGSKSNGSSSSGGGSSSSGGTTIDVTEKEFSIEPKTMTAKAGKITFNISNKGTVEHDIAVDVNGTTQKSDLIPAGKSLKYTVDITKPGQYQVYCTVPGHKEAGMVATLTVQ